MSKAEVFNCRATKEGGMQFTDYNRKRLKDWLKENAGTWLQIKPLRAESNKMRRFFEGGVVPFMTYYQDNMDYKNPDDRAKVREMLKLEFNGELAILNGKKYLIPKSTLGANVLPDFIERVIAWGDEQGYQTELLNPDMYKDWRDRIYPVSEIDSYIDYLLSIKRLK